MSTSIYCGLQAKRLEDIRQLKELSIKLTREWSMKSLGYDITVRDEERDQYMGFHIEEDGVTWNYFDGSGLHDTSAEIRALIQNVADKFPNIGLQKWISAEGPCVYEALFKDGQWLEIKQYTLDVYVEQDADYRILADLTADDAFRNRYNVKNVKLDEQEHFLLLTFEKLPVHEQDLYFDGIVSEMSGLLPGKDMYCFIVEDSNEGNAFEKKAVIRNGAANWQDITREEIKHLEANSDFLYGDNVPKAEYIGLLFGKSF